MQIYFALYHACCSDINVETLMFESSLICFVLEKKEKDVIIETRYTIDNVIGNGGFGTVYAGKRKKDGHLASALAAMFCVVQCV